jgi:presenilin-like A22 family membrane protease
MVIHTMPSSAGPQTPNDVIITHPNRKKPAVQATRATVVVLLLATAALVLVITVGGWQALEGVGPVVIQSGYVVIYLVLAFFAARWNRGALPVAAVLGVLLGTFSIVAGPGWFNRDKAGFAQPNLNAGLLGTLTLLVIPVQILLVAFTMRGLSQGWNVELEVRRGQGGGDDPYADAGGYGAGSPHLA